MCCALIFSGGSSHFAGRNLDLEYSIECIFLETPKGTHLSRFEEQESFEIRHALRGLGQMRNSYPLYFDAVNDAGIYMAALNFTSYASYGERDAKKLSLAHFEIIPYILGTASTLWEAVKILSRAVITKSRFDESTPLSELHFFLCGKEGAYTVEYNEYGEPVVYDNPYCVLTNNPAFPFHLENVSRYRELFYSIGKDSLEDKRGEAPKSGKDGVRTDEKKTVKGDGMYADRIYSAAKDGIFDDGTDKPEKDGICKALLSGSEVKQKNSEDENAKTTFSFSIKELSKGGSTALLPGALTSPERFIRAAYYTAAAKRYEKPDMNLSQAFHILDSVKVIDGAVKCGGGYFFTRYTAVVNLDTGEYFYNDYRKSKRLKKPFRGW